MPQYQDWKAPKRDEELLLWPAPSEIVASSLKNHQYLCKATDVLIQNAPLNSLRRQTRKVLGACDKPLIATGHQIEMYHPGVWVKNIVIDEVAKRVGGRAMQLSVDTDAPKHLQLRWPGGSVLMSDDTGILDAAWSGLVAPPTQHQFEKIVFSFQSAESAWDFKSSSKIFFDEFGKHLHDHQLASAITKSAQKLDQSLGLNVEYKIIDTVLDSFGYHALVYHLAADIERFARAYNKALAEYRIEQGIKTASRPMPDLQITEELIELPFWLDDLQTRERSRAVTFRTPQGWAIDAGDGGEILVFDKNKPAENAVEDLVEFLRDHQLRLSPRALTLTMFFRLLLVDQFVHGIGGGRYDQVTDRIIQDYFKLTPPDFSVTTATLYFPGAGNRSEACIPCVRSEGHRLRHNILTNKPNYLQSISSSPRRSIERKQAYLDMHKNLREIANTSTILSDWKSRLERTIELKDRESVLFDRELFYGIQTRERLTSMIDRYRILFG